MMGRFVFAAGITRKLNGNQLYTAQWKKNADDVMREHCKLTRNLKRFNRYATVRGTLKFDICK
jgi:hypothetical protein